MLDKANHGRPTKGGRAPRANASAEDIAHAITQAIVEHRIQPGARLVERTIGEVFAVSRTVVREALVLLERDHLVVSRPGSGAHVATPSTAEARELFAVRRMVEAQVIREFVPRAKAEHIRQLRSHIRTEKDAIRSGDVATRTRLLADFHVECARCLKNRVLEELLGSLVSRSSLIMLVYQSEHAAVESCSEHVEIVREIERGDVEAAITCMNDHLANVEKGVQLDNRRSHGRLEDALRASGLLFASSRRPQS